ncbi:chymotrypsin inhibitor-like [Augochlora pura]
MFALLFTVLLLTAMTTSSSALSECGVNEEFTSCGTACPLTCSNRPPNRNPRCTKNCIIGCQCKEGYLRNSAGFCVTEQEC